MNPATNTAINESQFAGFTGIASSALFGGRHRD